MKNARLVALLLVLVPLAPATGEEINRIVLRVNEQIATLREYEERRQQRVELITADGKLSGEALRAALADAGRAAMREIFDDLVLLSRAQQLRIVMTREQVDRAIESSRKRFGIETEEQFSQALAQAGLTLPDYRRRLERQMLTQEVYGRELQPRLKVDEDTLLRYWREHPEEFSRPERVAVRELVVLDAARPTATERQRLAAEIRQRLLAGEKLEAVADELAAKGATSKAVDLGLVVKSELDAALTAAVWGLPVGAVSEPVPGRGGLHLLQVTAREPAAVRPFSEVRAAIEEREQSRRYEKEMRAYLDELAAKSFIVEAPPAEAAGFRAVAPPPQPELVTPAAAPAPAAAQQTPPPAPAATPAPPPKR